jgi:hypothetical protein
VGWRWPAWPDVSPRYRQAIAAPLDPHHSVPGRSRPPRSGFQPAKAARIVLVHGGVPKSEPPPRKGVFPPQQQHLRHDQIGPSIFSDCGILATAKSGELRYRLTSWMLAHPTVVHLIIGGVYEEGIGVGWRVAAFCRPGACSGSGRQDAGSWLGRLVCGCQRGWVQSGDGVSTASDPTPDATLAQLRRLGRSTSYFRGALAQKRESNQRRPIANRL